MVNGDLATLNQRLKKALNGVIRSVNPDILAIQEIGDYPYLLELWNDFNNTGGFTLDMQHGCQMKRKEVKHLAYFSKFEPVNVKKQ